MDHAVKPVLTLLSLLVAGMAGAQAQVSSVATAPPASQAAASSPPSSQGLTDPTRPPAALTSTSSADNGAQAEDSGAPQLQSILVSREPGGRRVAVISGEMVRQGMKFRDAIVERVGDKEVVLRRGKTRETLKLDPKP